MNIRRDISLSIALCISLVMHGTVVFLVVRSYTRGLSWQLKEGTAPPIVTPQRHPVYVPEPKKPAPIPVMEDRMGEAEGTGESINSVGGEDPLTAPLGEQDQGFASRDDEGMGRPENLPSESTGPEGSGPSQPTPPRVLVEEDNTNAPFGVAETNPVPALPKPKAQPPADIKPNEPAEVIGPEIAKPDSTPSEKPPTEVAMVPPVPEDAPAGKEQANPSQPATPPAQTNAPGSPAASADPAPKTDSESDAFSREQNVDISGTKIQARSGRKVKTVRPRLSLAGRYDLATLPTPVRIVLQVKINEKGDVTSVTVLQSSGSNEVDLPMQQAMYEWWIEPPKDAAGKPLPDVMAWTIHFH